MRTAIVNYVAACTKPNRIDAAGAPQIATDLDGTPRPQGARFDIGAYEATN